MPFFPCIFKKSISVCNELYGDLLFSVQPYHCDIPFTQDTDDAGTVLCHGNVQDYIPGTPLLIGYDDAGTPLHVTSCVESVEDAWQAINFLTKLKIKKKQAEAVIDICGKDIFRVVRSKDAKALLKKPGLTEQKIDALLLAINEIVLRRRFIDEMYGHGVNCYVAQRFYNDHGQSSLRVVKKNPYLLRFYDVPFRISDRMAASVDDLAVERIEALLHEVIEHNENGGNTCMSFHQLCLRINILSMKSRCGAKKVPAFDIAYVMASKNLYTCTQLPDSEKMFAVYKKSTEMMEESAAFHVARLLKNAERVPVDPSIIAWIEKELGIAYAKEQKDAFSLLAGVAALTGGPGTGKTTTLNGVLKYFEIMCPGKQIALCAPTAAAARRMKEATGRNAFTIHKLLDVQPTGFGGYTSKNEHNRLFEDFIVVDESSMMDLEIFSMLVSSMKDGARLLLLGDKDQLSSVGAGDVLHDIMRCEKVPQVHLNKIFRQNETSSIILNSSLIRNGVDTLVYDSSSDLIECESSAEIMDQAVRVMETLYDKNDPFSVRMFVPARNRKFDINTEIINDTLQKTLNPSRNFLIHGTRRFYTGDPVVFLRNNYESGYMNGDTGIVVEIEKTSGSHKRLVIQTEDGTKLISGMELQDVAPAYAMTVHKSQGSECDIAVIVLPLKPSILLRRDLLYVAATRARKKNIFIAENNGYQFSISMAIANTWSEERVTGLAARLMQKTGDV